MSRYLDFKLGEKKLSDFGGIIINNGSCEENYLPSMSLKTQQIMGTDGEVFYDAQLDPRPIEEDIAIIDMSKFKEGEFKEWLNCKSPTWFNYEGSNKKIKVVRSGAIDSILYSNGETMTLSFIAHDPYWRLIDEAEETFSQTSPSVDTGYQITNKSNRECYPLIKLDCVGTQENLEFSFNDSTFRIKNITTELYIDCEHETVYINNVGEKISRLGEFECTNNGAFRFTFPKLNVGENTFTLVRGSLSKITIINNERYL